MDNQFTLYFDPFSFYSKKVSKHFRILKLIRYMPSIEWSKINTLPYNICCDTFIQSQQFKLLHRYVNVNANLNTWK